MDSDTRIIHFVAIGMGRAMPTDKMALFRSEYFSDYGKAEEAKAIMLLAWPFANFVVVTTET